MSEKRAEPIVQGAVETSIRGSFLSRLADERKGVRALSIRELDPEGRFERTVHCYPGRLSVFQRPLSALLSSVASLTTSISASGTIRRVADIRIGREPIHESEISYADPSFLLRSSLPLFNLLQQRGLSGPEITKVTEELRLRSCLEKAPSEMSIAERKRAATILGTMDRSRVIIFEAPFDGMSKDEVSVLARFLLDAARRTEASEQIYLATGVSRIPKIWRSTPYVRRSERTGSSHRGLKSVRTLVSKARELFAHSGTEGSSDNAQLRIVTRPQRVFVPVSTREVNIKNETIANPSIDSNERVGPFDPTADESIQVSPVAIAPTVRSEGEAITGSKKRNLTKVTATMKIARLAGISERKKRPRTETEPVLPTNVRVIRDRIRLRVKLMVYIAVIFGSVTILTFLFAA